MRLSSVWARVANALLVVASGQSVPDGPADPHREAAMPPTPLVYAKQGSFFVNAQGRRRSCRTRDKA